MYNVNSPATILSHRRSLSNIRTMCSGHTRTLRILEVESVMSMLADLSQAVAAYRSGNKSLDEFEDWFRTSSRKMFAQGQQAIDICAAVEAAFSRHSFEDLDEDGLKAELAKIDIPFAPPAVFRAASYQSPYNFLLLPTPANNSTGAMNHVI